MQVAVLIEPQKLVVEDRPEPRPEPGGLVVEIKAALTCGTDVKTFLRGHPKIPLPSPLGHEFSGVVSAVGEGCDNFSPGDEIMAVHSAPCNKCFYCQQGLQNLCESIMDTKVLGAFAERLALPAAVVQQNVYHKPSLITFAQAAFLEPLAAVVHGARVAGVAVGETVMVLGAGPIGLLFTMLLQQEGCYAVVVEPHKKRREMAARIGAPQVFADEPAALAAVRELTGGYGADLVVECTGVPAVWQASIDYVRRGGRVLLFGGAPPETQVSFDAGRLHYDQLQLIGAFHFTPADVARAVDLLTSEHFDPAPLITISTSLAGLGTSLRLLSVGEGIKTLVHP